MAIDTLQITRDPALGAALERGYTLPAEWYTRSDIFALEKERIFNRCWQYVGHSEQVAKPGDYITCKLGSVPIVIVRDLEGELRAFANVCRHRGSTLVLDASGSRKTIQCHYHGWTWNLDGSLRAVPRCMEQPDFEMGEFPLVALGLETWGPLLFVNADPDAAPLAATLGELPSIVAATGLDLSLLRHRRRSEYDIAANWKVVVENYNECYHCPIAHPSFADLFDMDSYKVVTEYEYFSVQHGTVTDSFRDGTKTGYFDARQEVLDAGIRDGMSAFIWPSSTIDITPGPANLVVGTIIPVAPDRTLQFYDSFAAEGIDEAQFAGMRAFGAQVQAEDIVLCESVQEGLSSGLYHQGKLMVTRENGIQHFQRLVYRALSA